MLQRHRREGDEPVGLGRADLRERLVLELDELARDVPLRRVPVGVDAERLDVDALLVHRADAVRRAGHEEGLRLERSPHQGHRRGHRAVRVHVHGLHALALHHHLSPPRLRAAVPPQETNAASATARPRARAASSRRPDGRGRCRQESAREIPACRHGDVLRRCDVLGWEPTTPTETAHRSRGDPRRRFACPSVPGVLVRRQPAALKLDIPRSHAGCPLTTFAAAVPCRAWPCLPVPGQGSGHRTGGR